MSEPMTIENFHALMKLSVSELAEEFDISEKSAEKFFSVARNDQHLCKMEMVRYAFMDCGSELEDLYDEDPELMRTAMMVHIAIQDDAKTEWSL